MALRLSPSVSAISRSHISAPAAALDVLVAAAAAHRDAAERRRQAVEGPLVDVDHGHVVAALVELGRGLGSHPPAADDDDPHGVCARSSVSARRHQTGAVELRMTYGTVRPASQPPPKRFL